MLRIDTHHHVIPPDYRKALQQAGLLEAGGRELPEWSPEASLQAMAELDVGTAILSVSTPGTAFLPEPRRCGRARAGPQRLHRRIGRSTARPVRIFRHRAAAAHRRVGRGDRALRSTNCTPTALCCWPTTPAPIWVRTARMRCSPPSTNARPWCSSTRPSCRGPRCPASRRSRPTSCSTPPAPHICWCATGFAPAIPTSGSS